MARRAARVSRSTLERAIHTCDGVLEALGRYPDRDPAIEQLERKIIDERLNLLGSAAARED